MINWTLRHTDKHRRAVQTVANFLDRSVYLKDAEGGYGVDAGAYLGSEYDPLLLLELRAYRRDHMKRMRGYLP